MDHGDQMEEKGIGFEGRREKKEKMTEEGEKRERTHSKVASI